MTTDGGLRQIFRRHISEAHWQSVETFSTGQGVPDMNFCLDGSEGWIEGKTTSWWALAHPLSPEQVGWGERRARVGGRYLLAVRRQYDSSPRRGPAADELYLFDASALRLIAPTNSIKGVPPLLHCQGGPARWDWGTVRRLMKELPR